MRTAEAFNIVCRLDRNGKLDEVSQDKKQKVATSLLRDKLHTQDFAGPISLRASKVLGPISRYRVADILPRMKLASRASLPGLTVGPRRILCNGLCTAERFHSEGDEQTCRVGCPDEPDFLSLSHYNECPLLYNMFSSIWEQASVLPRRNHLLHDLITQVFLRSLQYENVVMGFIDAFVYAHHQHRRSIENPGNLGDCMKGRIRFMTAITSASAHAYQETCLTRHMPAVPRLNFRLPKPQARYPHLPNIRTTTRERSNDFHGWTIYTDGGTRHVNAETLAGWGVIAQSLHGRIVVLFGPVITAEAHLVFSGARTHSNNTAEMTAMIEALSFLGPRGPVARDANSCIYCDSKHAAGVCVGTIQARTHVQLALACQQSMLSVQHRLRLTMQHVYGHTGNLGNECADHAALGVFGVSNHRSTRWVRHNFDTSACFGSCDKIGDVLENCVTLELKQHRCFTTGVSAVFLIVFSMTFPHTLHHMLFALSPFSRAQPFTEPCCTSSEPFKAQLRVFLPLRVLVKVSHTTCGILWWICSTSRIAAPSYPSSMKLTWLKSHSLVTLLLTYSATRKVFTILHDAALGTIALECIHYGMALSTRRKGSRDLLHGGTVATTRSS